jgi:hypothetical protein
MSCVILGSVRRFGALLQIDAHVWPDDRPVAVPFDQVRDPKRAIFAHIGRAVGAGKPFAPLCRARIQG